MIDRAQNTINMIITLIEVFRESVLLKRTYLKYLNNSRIEKTKDELNKRVEH